MSDGHHRTPRLLATVTAAAVAATLFVQAPGHAEPEIDEVRTKVDRLYHEAEIASERYNDIRVELDRSRTQITALRRDLRRQESAAEEVRDSVAAAVVSRYQGEALSSTGQVLLSSDPDAFIETLTTVAAHDEQQAQLMESYSLEAQQLELREQTMQREQEAIAEDEQRLAEQKKRIEAKAAEADELLATLEAEQRAELARRQVAEAEAAQEAAQAQAPAEAVADSASAAPAPVAVSGNAGAVVDFALGQVGKPYVWAAAGPGSYDCSGLTMMAWAQAGVSLPHSSGAQMSSGTPVSRSALQPGDLVFYYSPVSHVGIYIGNGQIVDAANPSTGVRVAGVDSMPYSGAVRPG